MKLISKLTTVYNRWRQRLDDIQYHEGYHWAKDVYFRGDLSFQALLDAATPVTCAFERGVMQAVIDIERDNNPEPEVNEVGEPVGVPFMVELNPGQPIRVHRFGPGNTSYVEGEVIDPEKEKAARKVEEDMGLRPKNGLRGWKQEGFSMRRRLGWTKVKGNT